MLKLVAVAAAMFALSATAAHAQYNLNIDMHGERGTYGAVDATFFGVQSDGSGAPTGVELQVSPYYVPGLSNEYAPASDFTVSYQFATGSSSGQLISYDYQNNVNGDVFSVIFDNNPSSPYYLEPTFTAQIQGHNYFAYPQDADTEGGFVNYSVSAAPEPKTWASLLFGVALMGSMLRRRRSAGAPATA